MSKKCPFLEKQDGNGQRTDTDDDGEEEIDPEGIGITIGLSELHDRQVDIVAGTVRQGTAGH